MFLFCFCLFVCLFCSVRVINLYNQQAQASYLVSTSVKLQSFTDPVIVVSMCTLYVVINVCVFLYQICAGFRWVFLLFISVIFFKD